MNGLYYLVDFVNWFGGLWSCFATFNSFGFVKAVISHPALPIKQLSVEIALGDLAPEKEKKDFLASSCWGWAGHTQKLWSFDQRHPFVRSQGK